MLDEVPGASLFVVDNDREEGVHDLDSVVRARYASGMNTPWRLLLAPLGLALVGTIGCSPSRGFCEAGADCNPSLAEIFFIPFDAAGDADDSVAVCVAQQNKFVSSLRANEEEKCHRAAEAWELYMACIGDEFAQNNDGCEVLKDDCEDERDDYVDAFGKLDGDCSSDEED